MTEHGETGRGINEHIEELRKKAEASRAAAEDYELQVKFLAEERELLEKYGQLPIAMLTTQFIIEQIAAATNIGERPDDVKIGRRITILRPRRRATAPKEDKETDKDKKYNIAPQVKSIMNAIFSSGQEGMPETLESVFDKMYPNQDWHSKIISIPKGINMVRQEITYKDDLNSDDSFIRRLISGADKVINTRMRNNNLPSFTFKGKVAAAELIQLYHTIDSIGWDIYDDFMLRNKIREPLNQL